MCNNKIPIIRPYLKGSPSPYHVYLKHFNFLFPIKFHGPDTQLLYKLWVLQMAPWNKIYHHIFCVRYLLCSIQKLWSLLLAQELLCPMKHASWGQFLSQSYVGFTFIKFLN